VLIRTTGASTAPGTNAVATVTVFAPAGNVDTMSVTGQAVQDRHRRTLMVMR
jgi:hypothetical protein